MSVPSYCPPRFRDQLLPVVNRTSDIKQLSKMCFISGKHTLAYTVLLACFASSDADHVLVMGSYMIARRRTAALYCLRVIVISLLESRH